MDTRSKTPRRDVRAHEGRPEAVSLNEVAGLPLDDVELLPPWTPVACCGERFYRDPATGKLHPTSGDPSSPHAHKGVDVVLSLGSGQASPPRGTR